jgi:GNAT superfamily N-acetyltransferase
MPELPVGFDNLFETFRALGKAAEGNLTETDEYLFCEGTVNHPVANFAVVKNLNSNDAGMFARHAAQRSVFHLYAIPTTPVHEMLRRAGFLPAYRMLQMQAPAIGPAPDPGSEPIAEIDVLAAASLMIETFFQRYGLAEQAAIRIAICNSGIPAVGETADGMVLSTALMHYHAETVGVYNLCVSASKRNKGLGRDLVRKIRTAAGENPVILQCDYNLGPWYQQLGFSEISSLTVYTIDPKIRPELL